MDRLLQECRYSDMLYLYTLILFETGARADSEALRLRWEDVDLAEGFIWIPSDERHRTKSGKGRFVPMTPRLAAAMREHFAKYRLTTYSGVRPEYVLHHPRRRHRAVPGERIKSFRRPLARAVQRAKLPEGWRRHDARHLRCTSWLTAGKDLVLVQKALGHSSVMVTMGYLHLVKENLRPLVEDAATLREQLRDELGA